MTQVRPVVVDASVALTIVRNEPKAPAARRALTDWSALGRQLLVPSHFWFEVVNPLARRHRWDGMAVLHAIRELDELGFTTVESDRAQVLLTIDLVERFRLTAFDAAYLALAQTYGADLATLDLELIQAAGVRAISLDDRRRLSETRAPYEHDVTWPDYKGASAYLASLRVEARRSEASQRAGQ